MSIDLPSQQVLNISLLTRFLKIYSKRICILFFLFATKCFKW